MTVKGDKFVGGELLTRIELLYFRPMTTPNGVQPSEPGVSQFSASMPDCEVSAVYRRLAGILEDGKVDADGNFRRSTVPFGTGNFRRSTVPFGTWWQQRCLAPF